MVLVANRRCQTLIHTTGFFAPGLGLRLLILSILVMEEKKKNEEVFFWAIPLAEKEAVCLCAHTHSLELAV